MIGAIAGDVIGSIYERRNLKSKDFPLFAPDYRFTDDTVLTVAVAEGDFGAAIRSWAKAAGIDIGTSQSVTCRHHNGSNGREFDAMRTMLARQADARCQPRELTLKIRFDDTAAYSLLKVFHCVR